MSLKYWISWSGILVTLCPITVYAEEKDPFDVQQLSSMTLTELLDLKVVSASRVSQPLIDAGANISVITAAMIQQRGYSNLVQVLQDLPGFDFATYEDGGGEYPNHSLNRGIGGGPGNPKLLIMIDGITQNHIGFNWSQLFGEEQIFADLERIEVIQGPVSAVYGANAFSGVVHFITQRKVEQNQLQQSIGFGQDNQISYSLNGGMKVDNFHLSGGIKRFRSDGDMGLSRPDPGGYFSANQWPEISLADYDGSGQYLENISQVKAGQWLDDGFNTQQDHWSLRFNGAYINPDQLANGLLQVNLGGFVWNKRQGLGSYVPGYEYQTTLDSHQLHHSAAQYTADAQYRLSDSLTATTSGWHRVNRQLPETGFSYNYRFTELIKSYHSYNRQWGIEQQFRWQVNPTDLLQVGARFIDNDKMEQVVSLGGFQNGHDSITHDSWFLATSGPQPQLGQTQQADRYHPQEQAIYLNYDGKFKQHWSYSIGVRVDDSDDYQTTVNPRFALIYNIPTQKFNHWNIKLLYGEAFREPSIFELNDEFRGNRNLAPEQIKTYELVSLWDWQANQAGLFQSFAAKLSLFQSDMDSLIALAPMANHSSNVAYANTSDYMVRGVTIETQGLLNQQWSVFGNYQYLQGKEHQGWSEIDNTAAHKLNFGINWKHPNGDWNVNLRTNLVGERKVPLSNSYFEDHAPGYFKANLTISWSNWQLGQWQVSPQLMVKNLFDRDYVGVGRQDGGGDIHSFDPRTNPNPDGFTPAYHPQPGRSIELKLNAKF